ncbi:addiction module protein [Methylomagnum sp.]
MNIQSVEQAALKLPVEERAKLAEKLLSSLEDLPEAEAERLWWAESRRRAAEIDKGLVQLIPADEVDRRIQAILE